MKNFKSVTTINDNYASHFDLLFPMIAERQTQPSMNYKIVLSAISLSCAEKHSQREGTKIKTIDDKTQLVLFESVAR